MSTNGIKDLFDHSPDIQTAVLRVVATVPTVKAEDTLLAMLIEVEEGDIYADVVRDQGFDPFPDNWARS
jgi:hypothetical protein